MENLEVEHNMDKTTLRCEECEAVNCEFHRNQSRTI